MIRALAILALLALAGCTPKPVVRVVAPPVPAQCAPQCATPCDTTRPRWDVDPADPKAWDRLGDQVIEPLTAKLDACEQHRRACHTCLQRLERAGLITLGEPTP